MIGNIDGLTVAGFIEGWVTDPDAPVPQLDIQMLDAAGTVFAEGRANRFRDDLADLKYGLGWCGFRLRMRVRPAIETDRTITLKARGRKEWTLSSSSWTVLDDSEDRIDTLGRFMADDPTTLSDVRRLRACLSVFDGYIARHGISRFIQITYIYVLGRPADADGLQNYGRLLRSGALMPFGLITLLAQSEEFKNRPRQLVTPTTPAFPYFG